MWNSAATRFFDSGTFPGSASWAATRALKIDLRCCTVRPLEAMSAVLQVRDDTRPPRGVVVVNRGSRCETGPADGLVRGRGRRREAVRRLPYYTPGAPRHWPKTAEIPGLPRPSPLPPSEPLNAERSVMFTPRLALVPLLLCSLGVSR